MPLKEVLMKKYLKFNLGFINHDVIVTRSKKEYKRLTKQEIPINNFTYRVLCGEIGGVYAGGIEKDIEPGKEQQEKINDTKHIAI